MVLRPYQRDGESGLEPSPQGHATKVMVFSPCLQCKYLVFCGTASDGALLGKIPYIPAH